MKSKLYPVVAGVVAVATIVVVGVYARGRASEDPGADASTAGRIVESECATQELTDAGATCYEFYGEENWDNPNGREVMLPVAVFEGSGDAPLVFFPGGPGYSSLGQESAIQQLKADADGRTLILLDHRGFPHAESQLHCPDYAEISPYHNIIHTPAITGSEDPMERMAIVADSVRACYDKLEAEGIDVAQYNQYSVSRDVDEIRRALKFDQIDAFGSSTGGGTVLSYLQYHPESVRSVILGWPWFNHLRNRAPVDEFYTTKQIYADVLALCVEESDDCRELIPAWFHEMDRARRALDENPYRPVIELSDGSEKELFFDGASFLDTVYLMLPDVYHELPSILAHIREGNYEPLYDLFLLDYYMEDRQEAAEHWALGYFLAHACNDMGTNRPTVEDATAAIEQEPAILGHEPLWLCAWWGTDGAVPPEHNDRPRSEVPGLAIHGQWDPCCTTRWSFDILPRVPNLQIEEFQGEGHAPTGTCRSDLINQFIADPYEAVDDSCNLNPYKRSV